LMHSALENLIRNAVSYTSDNSTVEITLMKSVHGGRAKAEIRVRDHGDGIPETELGKIFQPFYRLSPSRDRKSGGAGIGLAISERAIKLHRGTIEARNHPEGGLEIIVLLPL